MLHQSCFCLLLRAVGGESYPLPVPALPLSCHGFILLNIGSVGGEGFEPSALPTSRECSTTELTAHISLRLALFLAGD